MACRIAVGVAVMATHSRAHGDGGGGVAKKKSGALPGQPGLPFTSAPNPVPTRKPQEICIPKISKFNELTSSDDYGLLLKVDGFDISNEGKR